HPAVASAVVAARGSGSEAELAAYVIPHGVPVAAPALRQFLAHKLPAYMVPSTVTILEAFPLTANGKVDRQALPEPTRERSDQHELVPPRTALEKRLTAIWERELGINPIGITDNFLDLGVTSMVAASLFAAIEQDLGDDLPLGAFSGSPTTSRRCGKCTQGGPGAWLAIALARSSHSRWCSDSSPTGRRSSSWRCSTVRAQHGFEDGAGMETSRLNVLCCRHPCALPAV